MRRGEFVALLGSAAIAALLVTTSARADIGDCFSAVAPLEQAGKAAEIASKAAACAGAATNDPIMALTVLGLTAAVAAGEFSTSAQCKDKIDGSVGRLVAKALAELPVLPPDAKKLLLDYAHGYLPISLSEILAMTGLGFVAGYIECGCSVAGAAGDLAKVAGEYADSVKGCGEFIADAGKFVIEVAGNLGEAYGELMEDLFAPTGTVAPEVPCYPWYELPDDVWTDRYITAATQIYPCPSVPGQLVCKKGRVVVESATPGGANRYKCSTSCPEGAKVQSSMCYGTKPYTRTGKDRCVLGLAAESTCCGDGQRVIEWGGCSPACIAGITYWDRSEKACVRCQPGQYPVYEEPSSSVGSCTTCIGGQSYNFKKLRCECPLGKHLQTMTVNRVPVALCVDYPPCGDNKVRDEHGNCSPCGRGLVARGGKCVLDTTVRPGPMPIMPAVPARCPSGQVRKAGSCVFRPCPRGQVRRGAECVLAPCPRGRVRIGAVCALPPCPPGQIRQRGKCVLPPCPRGQMRRGDACVPLIKQAPIKPAPELKLAPPALICPPGTAPGPRGCQPTVR